MPTVNDWSRRLGVSKMNLKPDRARLRPADGRAHRRPHPAAADLAAAALDTAPRRPRSATSRRSRDSPRRHRRRRRPRHDARAAPAAGGRAGHAARARRLARRPRRRHRLRRPPGRPLLPRDRALGRAHARARRRARPARAPELLPGRRRLLRRRRDAPVQRARRLRALLAALAARARAPGVVRRPVPAAHGLRGARGHAAGAAGCAATAATASWTASGARCWTRASTPTTTSCPPPICGRARTGCARARTVAGLGRDDGLPAAAVTSA